MGTPDTLLELLADYNLLDTMAALHSMDPATLTTIIQKYAGPELLERLTFEAMELAGLPTKGKYL